MGLAFGMFIACGGPPTRPNLPPPQYEPRPVVPYDVKQEKDPLEAAMEAADFPTNPPPAPSERQPHPNSVLDGGAAEVKLPPPASSDTAEPAAAAPANTTAQPSPAPPENNP